MANSLKPDKNVLVIMCDQLRYDSLGFTGNPYVHTPNLDRLAKMSVVFDQCFTSSPVCSPARHSLATGKYPHAHGVLQNQMSATAGLRTIGHAVEPLGYRRFHLGHMHWRMDNHGYEPLACPHLDAGQISAAANKRAEWEGNSHTRRTTAGPSPNRLEEKWGYQVAVESIRQITEAVEQGQRFLSWTSFTEPHPPFYPPKELYEKYDQSELPLPISVPADAPAPHSSIARKQKEWAHLTSVEHRQMKAGYYGMIETADRYVGMMLDMMDRLKLWENTLLIFTSDHGDQMGDHQMFMKFVLREASVHVPLMICAPGVEPGRRQPLIEHVDLFPTICDYVGAEPGERLHGKSLWPLLHNAEPPSDWRTAVFSQIGTHRMIRTQEWKLNEYDGEPGELYHLSEDPDELYNLIGDSRWNEVAESLHRLMLERVATCQ
jgi:arylsulfatase A-like enzyme